MLGPSKNTCVHSLLTLGLYHTVITSFGVEGYLLLLKVLSSRPFAYITPNSSTYPFPPKPSPSHRATHYTALQSSCTLLRCSSLPPSWPLFSSSTKLYEYSVHFQLHFLITNLTLFARRWQPRCLQCEAECLIRPESFPGKGHSPLMVPM